jgi:hypothetical protein
MLPIVCCIQLLCCPNASASAIAGPMAAVTSSPIRGIRRRIFSASAKRPDAIALAGACWNSANASFAVSRNVIASWSFSSKPENLARSSSISFASAAAVAESPLKTCSRAVIRARKQVTCGLTQPDSVPVSATLARDSNSGARAGARTISATAARARKYFAQRSTFLESQPSARFMTSSSSELKRRLTEPFYRLVWIEESSNGRFPTEKAVRGKTFRAGLGDSIGRKVVAAAHKKTKCRRYIQDEGTRAQSHSTVTDLGPRELWLPIACEVCL